MASRRAQRRRGCVGKKAYTDLARAQHDARVLSARQRDTLHAYHCERCGAIHVGHQPGRNPMPGMRRP